MTLSGAEIVIEELVAQGVDTVFGYPGGMVIHIYDALYKNSHRITHVLSAHEQGAAHAADGYARVSGRTGVAIATSGPGATNLVTGIANAYLDSVPVVFITGNVPANLLGKDAFQEIDIASVTQPIVKHNYVVREIKHLQYTLREAFLIAKSGRKGPVLVDIPKNVQVDFFDYDPGLNVSIPGALKNTRNIDALDKALAAIEKSKRPFIYCGGGVSASDTRAAVIELSKKLGAPVALSMMGIGSIPDSYELNLGMCGMHGRYASTVAQSEADLEIALGVRFSDRATGNTKEYSKNCAVIHIDIDAAEIGKNISPQISLCGDLREILPMLVDKTAAKPQGEWQARVRELKATEIPQTNCRLTPLSIINCVNSYFDSDTVIATEVGQHQMWVTQYYKFEKPRRLLTSGGLGAMGFGLGAVIGACVAQGRKRAVLFTSEGSFGMNLTEFATAVTYKLPIVVVILNNGVLGMVRQWQTLFFDKRHSQTTLERKTDFPALARAFGAHGFSADSLDELNAALKNLPDGGPCLINCVIDKDEMVFPMIPAGGSARDIIINQDEVLRT
ncbi:MAG: biosynthetic-type acetolactate synthase large subunit [Treponema sp.]|nr:biosynthetic-type acetolactate synthase large subunit [Treponema sp.]